MTHEIDGKINNTDIITIRQEPGEVRPQAQREVTTRKQVIRDRQYFMVISFSNGIETNYKKINYLEAFNDELARDY